MAHAMHTPETTDRDTSVAPALQQAPGKAPVDPWPQRPEVESAAGGNT